MTKAEPYAKLLMSLTKIMGADASSIGETSQPLPGITEKANFPSLNPDDGSWKITSSNDKTLTAKGLLRICLDGENEFYRLRFSDKSAWRFAFPI